MAEVDKDNELPENEELNEEVDVELEQESDDQEDQEAPVEEEFYKNLAEDMDERVLGRLASELITDYKKDKVSRKDWETSYTQGLDLLDNFKHKLTKNYYPHKDL